MKKLFALIGLLCIVGCKPKPRPLKTYEVVITGKELNTIGDGFSRMVKQDTVMAVDDTTAYNKALIRYYAQLNAEKLTHNAVSTTTGFEVRDSTGMDLSIILPKNVVDSLTTMIEGFAKKH